MHTNDVAQALDRIVDVFPGEQQTQIRVQLANTLSGICYQRLLPRIDGGLVAAFEVMVATPAVRNLIREGKTHQIPSAMQTGGAHGMITMDASLAELVRKGRITRDLAMERAGHPDELGRLLTGGANGGGTNGGGAAEAPRVAPAAANGGGTVVR